MTKKQSFLPTARYVGPNDELRTGEAEYQGGRIHPINPEAHAKLREFWQAKTGPQQAREPLPDSTPRLEQKSSAARTDRVSRRINLPMEQLEEAKRRHEAGEPLALMAAELGVSTITLILRLRETGYDTSRRQNSGRRRRSEEAV